MDFYVQKPTGTPKAVVLVFHEAFGMTPHLREMCAWLAAHGYAAVGPDLFNYPHLSAEIEPAAVAETPPGAPMFSLKQDNVGFNAGRALIMALSRAETEARLAATLAYAQRNFPGLKVGVVGYCWGGSLAYLTASLFRDIAACSAYYGGRLQELVAENQPSCPTELHMADHDRYMNTAEVEAAFKKHHPAAAFYRYDADHGFNRTDGKTYVASLAAQARARTLALFDKYLAG